MSVIDGRGGAVSVGSVVAGVRKWSVESKKDIATVIASNTTGAPYRIAGKNDWNGEYEAQGHTPAVMPQDTFTFTGSIDGTNGVVGAAMVSSVRINIPIESGGEITHTVRFDSNGALTYGAAVAVDTGDIDPITATGCKVQIGTLATPSMFTGGEIADVTSVEIEITAANAPYVSSDTAGETKRVAGNIDFSIAIAVFAADFSASTLPADGAIFPLRVFVTATTFWEFLFAYLESKTGIDVDIARETIVGCTMNWVMQSVAVVGGTTTTGEINNPATTKWWPPA